jgi:hyperosmotically inducible periplasmic protein
MMNKTLRSQALSIMPALVAGSCILAGCDQRPSTPTPPASTSANETDNTGRNTRDSGTQNLTADNQGESQSDRKITAEIRQAVLAEKGLSINAQNCKIITLDGVVTLRGPVANEQERRVIEERARSVAGVSSVVNDLEVKGN